MKLTDNEIIKALEVCSKYTGFKDCEKCPLNPICDANVIDALALDLINRQKAEIENLKEKNSNLTSGLTSLQNDLTSARATIDSFTDIGKLYSEIKAEAYKEFAEKLKQNAYHNDANEYIVFDIEVDNLLKELVGE